MISILLNNFANISFRKCSLICFYPEFALVEFFANDGEKMTKTFQIDPVTGS